MCLQGVHLMLFVRHACMEAGRLTGSVDVLSAMLRCLSSRLRAGSPGFPLTGLLHTSATLAGMLSICCVPGVCLQGPPPCSPPWLRL